MLGPVFEISLKELDLLKLQFIAQKLDIRLSASLNLSSCLDQKAQLVCALFTAWHDFIIFHF